MSDDIKIKILTIADPKSVKSLRAEIEQLATASQKVSVQASAAAAKQAQAYSKIQQSAAQAATSNQKLATETQKTAAAKNTAAVAAQRLATEENRTARELANTSAAQMRAEKTALQLAAAQQRAAKAAKNNGLGPALPRTLDGLSGSAATLAKGFLTIQAAERGFNLVRVGAQATDAKRALDGLATSADTTGAMILTSLRTAAQGTIRDSALITSAATGITLTNGLIAKDLPQLVQIARASARATGQSVDFIFSSLVRGISRGSALIIDNAGITLDAEGAYISYAKSIGVSVDRLTDQQRQQAVLNAVLAKGADIVKQVGLEGGSAAEDIDRAVTSAQNLGEVLAQKVAPFLGKAFGGAADLINTGGVAPGAVAAGNAVNANLLSKNQDYQAYADGVTKANDQLAASFKGDPLLGFYAKMRLGLDTLTAAQFAYTQSLIQTGTASGVALQQAQGLADVDTLFTKALNSATTYATGARAELTALAPKIFEVANQSEHNRTAVDGLLTAYAAGRQSLPGLIAALEGLSKGHDIATEAAAQEARETRQLERSFIDIVPAANAAANAIAGVAGAQPKDRQIGGAFGTNKSVLEGLFGGGAATIKEFKRQGDEAERFADLQLQNRLINARNSAAKIKILQEQLAKTSSPIERQTIQNQIDSERMSTAKSLTSEADKRLKLEESTYDAINKQRQAQLDLVGLGIDNQRATAKEADEARRLQAALDSGRQSAARQNAIRLRLAEIQNDQAQRALKLEETQAAAQGSIANGRLLQSQPATATIPAPMPATGPASIGTIPVATTTPIAALGGIPALAPLPQSAGLIPPIVNVTMAITITDGKVTNVDAGGAQLTVLLNSARQTFASGG